MVETQSELTRLRARVDQLERQRARTNRGRVNQRRAAEYLGRSREFLRQRELRGDGPRARSMGPTLTTIWTPGRSGTNEKGAGLRPAG